MAKFHAFRRSGDKFIIDLGDQEVVFLADGEKRLVADVQDEAVIARLLEIPEAFAPLEGVEPAAVDDGLADLEAMDKPALIAYAQEFNVEVDARWGADRLRKEIVETLAG